MNEQQGEPSDGQPRILHSVQDDSSGDTAILESSSLDSARDRQDESLRDRPRLTGDEVLITHQVRAERTMTTLGAVSIGATISAILAAVFWAAYSFYGWGLCSGLPRQCPSSWVPYAVVAVTGFVVMVVIGAFIGWAFFRLYQIMRVD